MDADKKMLDKCAIRMEEMEKEIAALKIPTVPSSPAPAAAAAAPPAPKKAWKSTGDPEKDWADLPDEVLSPMLDKIEAELAAPKAVAVAAPKAVAVAAPKAVAVAAPKVAPKAAKRAGATRTGPATRMAKAQARAANKGVRELRRLLE